MGRGVSRGVSNFLEAMAGGKAWKGECGGGVLEFLGDEQGWDLRVGAVLSDAVYLLQFSYEGGGCGQVWAVCRGSL